MSLGVVSARKSTLTSASFNVAGPKGARRVMCASLVVQKLNNQSPLLSKQLNTPLLRYSWQAATITGKNCSIQHCCVQAVRKRFNKSQNAASLSVSPTG